MPTEDEISNGVDWSGAVGVGLYLVLFMVWLLYSLFNLTNTAEPIAATVRTASSQVGVPPPTRASSTTQRVIHPTSKGPAANGPAINGPTANGPVTNVPAVNGPVFTTLQAGVGNSTSGGSDQPEAPLPYKINYFGGEYSIEADVRLWLIVLVTGALGSTLHGLRSLYWYAGNRAFKLSWLMMYLMLPITGGVLGLGFYLLIRGGFFTPQASVKSISPFGFGAVAFLIGVFSQQAVVKLKQIAETVFTKPEPGDNARPQGAVSPTQPDFTLAVDPAVVQVQNGTAAAIAVKAQSVGGFSLPVELTISGLPTGAPAPQLATPIIPTAAGASSALNIDTTAVPPGNYHLAITGHAGGKAHVVTFELRVT